MPSAPPRRVKNKESAWRNPWRGELERLLAGCPSRRPPALRRSLKEEWLFAADLPHCADADACQDFMARAAQAGWETMEADGWIQIRRRDGALPEGWFPESAADEAACARELLRRHPGTADARRVVLPLLKAREEDPAAFEEACRKLHQELARRLRTGEDFPAIPVDDP